MATNNDIALGTLRVPPAWSPEVQESYRVHDWAHDVEIWCMGTELPVAQQGPAVAMRIGGQGRVLLRNLPPAMLVQGMAVEENGIQQFYTGVQVIIRLITRRWGQEDEEVNVDSCEQWENFRAISGERPLDLLARFESVRFKAQFFGGVQTSPQGVATKILRVLHINAHSRPLQGPNASK